MQARLRWAFLGPVMSLLLDAWRIIKAVPEAAGVALEAGKAVGRVIKSLRRMPKPRVPPREESMPLSHLDSEIQRRASHVPDWQKCCPFARSAGLHGEDCYDQGRPNCPFRETTSYVPPEERVASPRAVTERPRTIIPPKR